MQSSLVIRVVPAPVTIAIRFLSLAILMVASAVAEPELSASMSTCFWSIHSRAVLAAMSALFW